MALLLNRMSVGERQGVWADGKAKMLDDKGAVILHIIQHQSEKALLGSKIAPLEDKTRLDEGVGNGLHEHGFGWCQRKRAAAVGLGELRGS